MGVDWAGAMSRNHRSLYRTRRWQHVRRAVLDGANWRCRECGRYGNEVDHIRPLHRGGDPYDRGNLQVLCRTHHIAKTGSENRREPTPAESRWRVLVDAFHKPL